MKLFKVCWYQTRHYNLWPVVIVLPTDRGIIIQLKVWNRHAGIEVGRSQEPIKQSNRLFVA
jgi:hypothetical protein